MKYKLIDDSSDRKYFTIVPNYVLNHSSAIDKAIYIDMKRAAGENGRCFMTEQTMCKRNGIGEKALHKSLKYLLKHNWIEFVGMTAGKTRPIKTYKISDIWEKNVGFYSEKKIPSESGVSKDTPPKLKDTLRKQDKIPFERGGIRRSNTKEKPIKKTKRKKYSSLSDIKEADIIEIAKKYEVGVSLVRLQLEKLTNYCESKGKRYKNYKSALRNFILGTGIKLPSKVAKKEVIPVEPADFVPISPNKLKKLREETYRNIGTMKALAQVSRRIIK